MIYSRNTGTAEPRKAREGEAHKMSGKEGGENWSKLCGLEGRVSALVIILEGELLVGVKFNPVLFY